MRWLKPMFAILPQGVVLPLGWFELVGLWTELVDLASLHELPDSMAFVGSPDLQLGLCLGHLGSEWLVHPPYDSGTWLCGPGRPNRVRCKLVSFFRMAVGPDLKRNQVPQQKSTRMPYIVDFRDATTSNTNPQSLCQKHAFQLCTWSELKTVAGPS